MSTIEATLALLLAIAVVSALAKWVPLPGPLLLVAGGVLLSFVPLLSDLHIEPEIFFALLIPPLLFADGWLIPKRDLLSALRPILLLAFGPVFLTVVAIGYLIHWLIPELPLAAAFAPGAIVSPTDAVATAATTERLQVPSRITSILNGESLINDASGLVAFKFAVAAVAAGVFSLVEVAGQFVLLAGGGFLIGLAVAWIVGECRVRLTRICADDPTVQTTLSLLTPFAAYLVDTLADAERKLRLAALRAERAELHEMREADVNNDETLRSIEAEIDHAESFVAPTALRGHG